MDTSSKTTPETELNEIPSNPNSTANNDETLVASDQLLNKNNVQDRVTSPTISGQRIKQLKQEIKFVRPYDLIIFAASGGVGRFIVEELALVVEKNFPSDRQQQVSSPTREIQSASNPQTTRRRVSVPRQVNEISWAVAGRSAMKLNETLCEAELSTGIKNLSSKVPIVLADLRHHRSLLEMCQKTELVINCAGPYSLEGEAVIKACIESKTNYIDLSHETTFIERIRENYSQEACQKGIYIINGCGFQSMSAEMGLNFIKQVVDGEICEVRIIMNLNDSKAKVKSISSESSIKRYGIVSQGMWRSILSERVENFNREASISSKSLTKSVSKEIQKDGSHKQLIRRDTETLVRDMVKIKNEDSLAWFQLVRGLDCGRGYCVPLNSFTSEESQMIKSEMQNYELRKPDLNSTRGWKPIRCTSYMSLQYVSEIIFLLIWLIIFEVFIKFSPLRYLMRLFPAMFSIGNVSNRKLDRDSLSHIKFCQTFLVYGTPSETGGDPLEERNKDLRRKQEKLLETRVVGPEPNHVATATYAVQAALALIAEKEHLPKGGGVMTPGVAFLETNIIYQLRRRNIKFEVLKKA